MMLEDPQLEHHVRKIIIDVCAALYENGITVANVGGLMRLVGVPDEEAQKHDDEYIEFDQDLKNLTKESKDAPPPGTTLH